MYILGIDPGTATTGWGIIKLNGGKQVELVNFGCILTQPTDIMGARLSILKKNLDQIIKSHKPDHMAVEKLFFGANVTSAISVGQARGVVLLSAAESNVPLFEYTGLQVKLAVADHGRADKKSIQTAVRRYLRVKNLPKVRNQVGKSVFSFRDDAYDAVAVAICHLIKSGQLKEKEVAGG